MHVFEIFFCHEALPYRFFNQWKFWNHHSYETYGKSKWNISIYECFYIFFYLNWDVKYVLLVAFWIFYVFFKVSLEYFSLWYIITCIIKFKHNNCTSVLLNPPFCKSSPSLMMENLKNNMKYKVTRMIEVKTAKSSFLNSSVN